MEQIHSLSPKSIVVICTIVNIIVTILVGFFIISFSQQSPYLQFGPSDTLVFIGVAINTWLKYASFLAFIAFIQFTNVVYAELAGPIVSFNVYDPNTEHVNCFTKNELQILANVGFTTNGIKTVLSTLLSVTQIDLALWNVVVYEVFCIFTVRFLLNKKTFM